MLVGVITGGILYMDNQIVVIVITIRIPKNATISTRAEGDGINISYTILDEGSETTYAKVWQAIMFEDTQNGDYWRYSLHG